MTEAPASETSGLAVGPPEWVRWLWIPGMVALVALTAWWSTHPGELPVDTTPVLATAASGQTLYIGILGPEHASQRNLQISGVRFQRDGVDRDVRLEAWVCQGSSIAQSTDPTRFCEALLPAGGETLRLGGGDQLVISVAKDSAGTVELRPVQVSFREGLQWGTHPAGPPVTVEVIG